VTEDELEDSRGGNVLGLRNISGWIDVDFHEAMRLMQDDEPLTLTLEDGRRLNFHLRTNDGEIVRAEGGDF
jgi:hypothetical protein